MPSDPGGPQLTCPNPISVLSSLGIPITVVYNAPTISGGFPPIAGPVCAPSSGSMFNPGTSMVSCFVADARQRTQTCSFAVTVTVPPRLLVSRFVAFGDSITWGEDGSFATSRSAPGTTSVRPRVQLPTPDTYPGALQTELGGRYTLQSPQVKNEGNPGESVTDPATFIRFTTRTSSGQYDVVLLMEGANDLGNQSYFAITGALGQMIDYARNRGLRVFVATIPPENPLGCCPLDRGREAPLVPGLNDQVRILAASKGVPLVDVYQAFGGDLTLIGPDGLHPTAAGYHRIADTFFAVIRQTLEATATTTGASPARPTPGPRPFVAGQPR